MMSAVNSASNLTVSLSKRGADMAITLERPERGQYVFTKLCDYQLKLYGTRDYFEHRDPIRTVADLRVHAFIDYVADLAFSHELLYLNRTIPNVSASLYSTSIISQYHAALQGNALPIPPCFMATPNPELIAILADDVVIARQFWLSSREDLRKLRRIASLWDYLRATAEANRAPLQGESAEMRYVQP
jgi:DNA-binding transcriptional LysR family regulator